MSYKPFCTSLLLSLLFFVQVSLDAKIVFDSKRDGNTIYHVYMMDDDGSNIQRITNADFYDFNPSWFPNGKRIAFERDLERGSGHINSELYIIDKDGQNEHRFMENHKTDKFPNVSPDGKHIAFFSRRSGEWNIHVFDLVNSEVKQLTHNLPSKGFSRYMDWSPDGKMIAYQHTASASNIWIMDADGNRKTQFSPDPKDGTKLVRLQPAWSPSGTYIMYVEEERTPEIGPSIATRLIIQNLQTGSRSIHHFPKVTIIYHVCWMKNDQTVLLCMTENWKAPESNFEIYRYELASRKKVNLTDQPGGDYRPRWISDKSFSVPLQQKKLMQWGQLKTFLNIRYEAFKSFSNGLTHFFLPNQH